MPDLVQVVRKYEKDGGAGLLVSFDMQLAEAGPSQVQADLRTWLGKRNWGLPVLLYAEADVDPVSARFDLPGAIPVTLAFDKNGKLVDREDGAGSKERFEAMMRKALGKP